MSTQSVPVSQERIEAACALVRERLTDGSAERVMRFVRQYYRGVAAEDLDARSVEDLYGAALSHWHFASERRAGEARVRIYNPQLEEHGWQSTHSVVELVLDDMPFLVDSVRMAVNRLGSTIHLVIHPVMRMRRAATGELLDVLGWAADDADTQLEAVMMFEIDRHTASEALDGLHAELLAVIDEVRAAVQDWPAMRERLRTILDGLEQRPPPVERGELDEARAFLEWLLDDHFTFLGYREYELHDEAGETVLRWGPGSGLGLRRGSEVGARSQSFDALTPALREEARRAQLLVVTKAHARSRVHRSGFMDYVGIKRFGDDGQVLGEQRFLGLYTSAAYNRSPRHIPLLRRKVDAVLAGAGYPPRSHAGKALVNILETYPRDVLFQVDDGALLNAALEVLHLQERQRIRLLIHPDRFGRFAACVVYVPRERFRTEVRLRMQEILEQTLQGEVADFTVQLSESVLARLYFLVQLHGQTLPDYDRAAIETQLRAAARAWSDDLAEAVLERFGEEQGNRLLRRYGEAFRSDYREQFSARLAVRDIEHMETLDAEAGVDIAMSLHRPLEAGVEVLHFKLFQERRPVPLSDALPVLENMGLRVIEERPSKIKRQDATRVFLHEFSLTHVEGARLDLTGLRENFQDTFAQVWHGLAESDGFNRLVLRAGLACREIVVLRAYCKFLRQARSPFSQRYMEQALGANPDIAAALVALFNHRFDPRLDEAERLRLERAGKTRIEELLDAVVNLDEDRILRGFLGAILATVRCSYHVRDAQGAALPYLALKFDCAALPELPDPRPLFEIFVYSPRVEGVHLRGSRVARGGLRWSDRPEDFRTEVLGLVKAQMVKNAVIVPTGSKGGFVPKRLPDGDRDAVQREAVACYQLFIRALLDLTDNLVDGQIVPPGDVVRHDQDDPYLVVAADKGTATFSDIANSIALERGFWLGDAFASGGSAGYDHKGMGITARGAWESVKRHFRELDLDIQTRPFSVVGIGDMSGDVFGNGMLLSPHIRLLAAFNHLHIFLDPDPDAARALAERRRLFNLPRSGWTDYDRALISPGGGVFSRAAKSITLSAPMAAVLGVAPGVHTPNAVIRAILSAPVDLLWNGGIGTYAKADEERHADVGDRANDALRVNASALRCRVIGEGGNLGFTQRARVQFALAGGRVYTDAIDNSAGVDCSDHEVNIKVLLGAVVVGGDMTGKQRNALLAQMTEEVGELVLRNNYLQTQALSLAACQAAGMLDVHTRLMRLLEREARLDRGIEALPDAEVIAERAAAGRALVAPELAVLMAYTKIHLYQALVDSDLPEDASSSAELAAYFPSALRERFPERIEAHQLRREIIATVLANELVNREGMSFAFRLGEETGAGVAGIARAYLVAREVFGMRAYWAGVEALDTQVPASVQLALLLEARRLQERAARWLLRHGEPALDVDATAERYAPGTRILAQALPGLLPEAGRGAIELAVEAWTEQGVPEPLARQAAQMTELFSALDIVEVAAASGEDVRSVAAIYFGLSERLDLAWLRDRVVGLSRDNRWQALSRAALRDELYAQQAVLAAEVLEHGAPDTASDTRIEAWVTQRAMVVERYRQVLGDLMAGPATDFAMLSVLMRELRGLGRPRSSAA